MPSEADRQLRALMERVDNLAARLGTLELLRDRVDDLEDQNATVEQRLTRAGFPRDTRPPSDRSTHPSYRPPNIPPDVFRPDPWEPHEDDERDYRPPGHPDGPDDAA